MSTKSNEISMRASTPFIYDQLSPGMVRYFKLNLNGQDEPLSGRLISTYHYENPLDFSLKGFKHVWKFDGKQIMERLSESMGYDCLSYAWGEPSGKHWLTLSTIGNKLEEDDTIRMDYEPQRNGKISITNNLYDFLLELRRKQYNRFIWIDAICINQESDAEKAIELPMMRDIYEYARQVLIWLGVASDAEQVALAMLHKVTLSLNEMDRDAVALDPTWPTTFEQTGLPDPDNEFWKGIGSIMSREYWSRLWTLQEVVVPNDGEEDGKPILCCICGEIEMPLKQFDDFALALPSNEIRAWIITGKWGITPDSLLGFDGLAEIRTCRESYYYYRFGVSLSALLLATRRRRAKVKADMVFGMLAMVDRHTAKKLALDISQPVEVVFVNFGKHYIRNEAKEILLNHTVTREKLPNLPSWCPNFASPPLTISLGSRWLGHYESSTDHRAQMYCAGFSKHGKWMKPRSKVYFAKAVANTLTLRHPLNGIYNTSNRRQIKLIPKTNFILASGLRLDTVTAIVDCNSAAESTNFFSLSSLQQTGKWLEECFELATKHLPPDAEGFDMFARTLVGNRVAMEVRSDDSIIFDREHEFNLAERYLDFKRYLMDTKKVGEGSPDSSSLDKDAQQYATVLSNVTRHRRFFATANGRIGLGPSDTTVGDLVGVIFFCPTPYLLRLAISGRYQLVGEAYVHGIMYGEALAMFDRREIKEVKWTIE